MDAGHPPPNGGCFCRRRASSSSSKRDALGSKRTMSSMRVRLGGPSCSPTVVTDRGGTFMSVVEVDSVSYSYGAHQALHDLSLSIPEGALYALLGPNGSGKTTLLQILMGLRRARKGHVSLFGVDSDALTVQDRASIGYIAEGQALPGWMRLDQLEAYLA